MRNFYLPKCQSAVSICGTTTYEGDRNPYLSGIFLPTIHFLHVPKNWGALSYAEFAVRATRRNKAEFIRANNAGYSYVAVEPLSHHTSDNLLLTKHTRNLMKNPQNLTALLAGQCCTPQSLGGVREVRTPIQEELAYFGEKIEKLSVFYALLHDNINLEGNDHKNIDCAFYYMAQELEILNKSLERLGNLLTPMNANEDKANV